MKKKLKNILIGISLAILVGAVFYFGLQQSVLGVSDSLDFQSEFSFNDAQTGLGVAEGYLTLPKDTTNFAFTVDYKLQTIYKNTATGKANVKYELFNYKTNSWETIHDKSWSIVGRSDGSNDIDFDGENVYIDRTPERTLVSNLVSSGTYDKYYGCLDGMTIEEAKILNPPSEGTSTYRYYCAYPDSTTKEYDYRDSSNEYDLIYFPRLIIKTSDYINQENKALFRITYNPTSSGFRGLYEGNFRIKLWTVETPKIDVWTLVNGSCIETKELYTYQLPSSFYYTANECMVDNGLIVIPPITGDVTDNDTTIGGGDTIELDKIDYSSLYYVIGIILLLLILFWIVRSKRRKRK